MRTLILLLTSLTLSACYNTTAVKAVDAEPVNGVHSHTLDNGMKVLVKEVGRAPVVVSQVWYKVGSSYEYDGITGVSHILEHMMFKGTENHPAGEFSEIIAANGGRENAFTGKDFTAYFQRIANDRLELCLRMESDRMTNLLLQEEDFIKELEVVKEERRLRTEDNPMALTYERFNSVAWNNNPYRQPIIGWMEDIETMTVDDMRYWYRKWYAPNNATLIVVGDVKAAEVFSMAEEYFGGIEPSEIKQLKPRKEARQLGTRRIEVKLPAKLSFLVMGYKVPSLNTAADDQEVYALEVLSGVLDGGSSARLARELVRGSEIATSVGASYGFTTRHETMLTLSAIPAQGIDAQRIETELRAQIDRLKEDLVGQEEIDRVIAQVLAGNVYEQDSSFYQAMKMGIMETIGAGWERTAEYTERIRSVTPEQIREVARKYLIDDNLTVAELVPQPISEPSQVAGIAGGDHHAR